MAVARQLPNGMLVLILTPREAVAIADELLDPSKFPWQSTETELIALDAKSQLMGMAHMEVAQRLEQILSMIPEPQPVPDNDEEEGEEDDE